MVRNVDDVLLRNREFSSKVIRLTAGNEAPLCGNRLHTLLPGDSLQAIRNSDTDFLSFHIYSDGLRIGTLMWDDAETLDAVLKYATLKGLYVAEQNCYGDHGVTDLAIIIFYSPTRPDIAFSPDNDICLARTDSSMQMLLFQN